jgi:hypothetical protein
LVREVDEREGEISRELGCVERGREKILPSDTKLYVRNCGYPVEGERNGY